MINRIVNWIKSIVHINRYKQEMEVRVAGLEEQLRTQFDRDFVRLIRSEEKLISLNTKLSTTPVIWGDEARLDISEKAAVFSCFLNTNSGTIRIGDYTYAGSGVCLLAGSHDPELGRFLRRDVEYKEGFDIDVGRGVWLGSNATILGPSVIDDDAVVAAGAVVVPGTHIRSGEVYAGIPARKIKDLTVIENLEEYPEKLSEVTQRESGILFYPGWSEKKKIESCGQVFFGHWTEEESSVIYSNKKKTGLVFIGGEGNCGEADIYIEGDKRESLMIGKDPVRVELIKDPKDVLIRIVIETKAKVFVSAELQEEEHIDGTD